MKRPDWLVEWMPDPDGFLDQHLKDPFWNVPNNKGSIIAMIGQYEGGRTWKLVINKVHIQITSIQMEYMMKESINKHCESLPDDSRFKK